MKKTVQLIELNKLQDNECAQDFFNKTVSNELAEAIQELILNLRNNKPLS